MAKHYDVIVLGGGNAGQAAAGAAIKAGKSVALIEGRDLGGTCPNRGCVPKKVLVAVAETLDTIARAGQLDIEVSGTKLDWPGLIARKRELIGGMPASMEKSLVGRGIDVIAGHGRFTGPGSIAVGERALTADKIVIATGSVARPLPIDGAEHLATSDDVLDLPALPAHVTFVGGGVIAFELGHVLARAGARVSILEVAERPLGPWDPDAVERLLAVGRDLGIELHTSVRVESIARAGDRFRLTYRAGDAEHAIETDLAVNAAGRVPRVDDLDLGAAGIEHDRYHVARDAYLRSEANPNVYLAGDVLTGAPHLSPVATHEGRVVGHNLISDELRSPDYTVVPRALFTVPTLAAVGLGEAEADERGIDVEIKENDMTGWLGAKMYAERTAYAKVLVSKADDTIVGAHLLGHGAGETVHVFAMAMRHGITATSLREELYAYPTFTNDVKFLV